MKWAKTNTNWLRLTSFSGILLLSLLTLATIFQPFASAAYLGDRPLEYGYFYNQFVGGRKWDDVIPGGIPNTADKNTFINFITNKYYNGSQQEKTGAAFIINLQLGNSGSGSNRGLAASDINGWALRIQQPQVSFSMENYSFSYNSAYDTPTDDDLFYADSDTRWSLVIRYNGAIVSVIKQDCANPLDGNPGIPNTPPPPPPPAGVQGFILEENTGTQVPANVSVSGVGTETGQNPFFFVDGHPGHRGSFTAGSRTIQVSGIPPGYTVVGSTICGGSSPCGSGQPSSSTSGQNFAAGASRTFNFASGVTYDMRWILRRTVTLTCVPPTVNPSAVEPTTTYTVQIGASVSPAAFAPAYAAIATATVSVVGPGVNYTSNPPLTASGGTVSATVTPGPTNNTGTYTISFTISGAWGSVTCPTVVNPAYQFQVGYHPYFRVEAGDVTAGAGSMKSDGTCTASTAAQIRGSNKGSGGTPAFLGAGAQLGALALGVISGFPTSTNEGGGSSGVGAGTGTGLTFANTPSLGSFGALPCTPDYATDALAEAATVTPLASGSYNLATLSSGTYQVASGNVSLSGNLPSGRQVTIVVMGGNAILTGNVNYGGYSSPSDAPQFKLIVTNGGNIKVKNDVTELHGVYIALPNTTSSPATGGTLSTCYDTATGADSVDYNTCKYKLTFYGAVVVNTLLLERTYGSLAANPSQGVLVQPSETFNDTPELWAASGSSSTPTGIQTYDSIVSLPPVL